MTIALGYVLQVIISIVRAEKSMILTFGGSAARIVECVAYRSEDNGRRPPRHDGGMLVVVGEVISPSACTMRIQT